MTRVAGVDPGVWASLFLANSDFLSAKIDGLISRLSEFRDALDLSDIEALRGILSRAKTDKERIVSAR
jgi:prephenate dehydrogenase